MGLVAEFENNVLLLDAMRDTRNRFDFVVTTPESHPSETIGCSTIEVRRGFIFFTRSTRDGRRFDKPFAADTVFKIIERAHDRTVIDVIRFTAGGYSVQDHGALEELCLGSITILKSLESRGASGNPG